MKVLVTVLALLVIALFASGQTVSAIGTDSPIGNTSPTQQAPALQAPTCTVGPLLEPSSGITTTTSTQTFTWSIAGTCTTLTLVVSGPTRVDTATVNAATSCPGGASCSFTPSFSLANGVTSWWVIAPGGSIDGPNTFTVDVPAPAGFTSPPWTNWHPLSGTWFTIGSPTALQLYTAGQPNLFATDLAEGVYTDLDFQVQMLRYGCAWCAFGLDVRASDKAPDGGVMNAYQFEINRNGYFSVWRGVKNNWTALQYWTYTPAIKIGNNWNTLRVLMTGSNILFLINGTPVWSGSDSTLELASGQVGAFIARVGSTTTTDALLLKEATLSIPVATLKTLTTQAPSAAQLKLNADANSKKVGTRDGGPH